MMQLDVVMAIMFVIIAITNYSFTRDISQIYVQQDRFFLHFYTVHNYVNKYHFYVAQTVEIWQPGKDLINADARGIKWPVSKNFTCNNHTIISNELNVTEHNNNK